MTDASKPIFYSGPAAVVKSPSADDAWKAESTLQDAFQQNTTEELKKGISPEQADTLMQWMVYRTRKTITSAYLKQKDPSDDSIRSCLERSSLIGACGFGRGLMGLQAEMLGINHYYHESLEFNSQQHAFSILSMPIQKENGSPSLKHFLADTTFKQFCIDEFENIDIRSTSAQELSWGASLTKTPEGKRVADALLCQGYIEITPEIAELYIKSGLYKKDYAELDIPTNEILPKLLISTTDNDVFISDIVKRDYDLRPPSLVMSNAPLETMPTYRELRKPNLPAAESAIKSDSISFDVLTAFTGNLAEVVAIETLTSDVLDTFVVDTTNLPKTPKRISRMKK